MMETEETELLDVESVNSAETSAIPLPKNFTIESLIGKCQSASDEDQKGRNNNKESEVAYQQHCLPGGGLPGKFLIAPDSFVKLFHSIIRTKFNKID